MRAETLAKVATAMRAAAKGRVPDVIRPSHSFILDLGFDSMSIVTLGLTLEDEFHCSILLDHWIGAHPDPLMLTVGSLCEYVESKLA